MSTKPKIIKHLAALGLSKLTPPQIVANANHYAQQMTGNAHFPQPSPALADVTTQSKVVETAYALSQTRARGSVSKMHVEVKGLARLLKGLAAYVETIANADPDNAENIIISAGMPVKKHKTVVPKTFTAKAGKNPGTVVLNNKAIPHAINIYQMSTDPNNPASWVTLVTDTRVRYVKTGLTSGIRYFFRTAQINKGVQSAYSPVVDVIIS